MLLIYYYKAKENGPIVVEGHDVHNHSGFSQTVSPAQTHNMSLPIIPAAQYQAAEPPGRGCRDPIFAILFYAHLAVVGWTAATYTPIMVEEVGEAVINVNNMNGWGDRRRLNEDYNDDVFDINFDATHLTMIIMISCSMVFVVSSLALVFMISCAQPLIKMALIFNIMLTGALMAFSFAAGAMPMGVVFLILGLMAAYYAFRVW
ncbi:hypothetical protein ACA910_021847 [Epithemia clementina (nom. ined.)]